MRLTNISPLVRYIIELRERGGTAPAVSPIIGGSTAQLNQYPWQLLVLYIADNMKGRILCSGTILNIRTVLTAGHCCDFDTEQRYVYVYREQ